MLHGQMFLIDAGGQYLGYTTDITRTPGLQGPPCVADIASPRELMTRRTWSSGRVVPGEWRVDRGKGTRLFL